MAPSGGLFATQRRHWVETERGRCDRYMANVPFGWFAGTLLMPEKTGLPGRDTPGDRQLDLRRVLFAPNYPR